MVGSSRYRTSGSSASRATTSRLMKMYGGPRDPRHGVGTPRRRVSRDSLLFVAALLVPSACSAQGTGLIEFDHYHTLTRSAAISRRWPRGTRNS